MNVTWSEASQIASEIVEKLGIDLTSEVGHDRFDALTSAIFDHRDTHWSDHEQKWIANGPTNAQHVAALSIELGTVLSERDSLKNQLSQAEAVRDQWFFDKTSLSQRLDAAQGQLSELRVQLAEARDAIDTVNERLRTATACKCQMVEVTQGRWEIWRTIDCPVHPHTLPGEIYQLGHSKIGY